MKTIGFVIRFFHLGSAYPIYLTPMGAGAPMGGKFEQAARFPDESSARAALDICSAHNLIGAVHGLEKWDNHEDDLLGEEIASNRLLPTHETLRTKGPVAFIVALAESFPALRGKLEGCGLTAKGWDVDKLIKYSGPWSHGEKVAALFVACVWNPSYAASKKWRFDTIDAISVWDNKNRAAFVAWCKNPVWP
jgi:hypothetical protein